MIPYILEGGVVFHRPYPRSLLAPATRTGRASLIYGFLGGFGAPRNRIDVAYLAVSQHSVGDGSSDIPISRISRPTREISKYIYMSICAGATGTPGRWSPPVLMVKLYLLHLYIMRKPAIEAGSPMRPDGRLKTLK
jgi:hypothetical protein